MSIYLSFYQSAETFIILSIILSTHIFTCLSSYFSRQRGHGQYPRAEPPGRAQGPAPAAAHGRFTLRQRQRQLRRLRQWQRPPRPRGTWRRRRGRCRGPCRDRPRWPVVSCRLRRRRPWLFGQCTSCRAPPRATGRAHTEGWWLADTRGVSFSVQGNTQEDTF